VGNIGQAGNPAGGTYTVAGLLAYKDFASVCADLFRVEVPTPSRSECQHCSTVLSGGEKLAMSCHFLPFFSPVRQDAMRCDAMRCDAMRCVVLPCSIRAPFTTC